MARRRVLVVSTDPVTERMPGPAIRAWHLAEVLAARHEVTLASTVACTRAHPALRTVAATDEAAGAELERWADVLVVPAGILHAWPFLARSTKVLAVDLYDPYHLENLEPDGAGDLAARRDRVRRMVGAINDHLRRGDFFLCASERQRDFWAGALAAAGRVNPDTYDEDPRLASLLAVVPFGIPADPPRPDGPGLRASVPGLGPRDRVVVWAGGVYNWFDPVSLVRAAGRLAGRMPELRLVFLGMQHPNPAVPAMRAATEARAAADALGLAGRTVVFNEGWVPYDRRAALLLDADAGASTHHDHLETRYSFRTRVLDYLWAGLPMVLTEGDVLADAVAAHGLGCTVPAGDVDAIAAALESVLLAGRPAPERFAALTARLRWDRVAEPLAAFCEDPRPAADRRAAGGGAVPAPDPGPTPGGPAAGAPGPPGLRQAVADAAAALGTVGRAAAARARRRR